MLYGTTVWEFMKKFQYVKFLIYVGGADVCGGKRVSFTDVIMHYCDDRQLVMDSLELDVLSVDFREGAIYCE